MDVQAFDTIDAFPYPCLFWRVSEETNARHRNPLFDTDDNVIGITAEDSFYRRHFARDVLGQHERLVQYRCLARIVERRIRCGSSGPGPKLSRSLKCK